jgi:hypothetical protein
MPSITINYLTPAGCPPPALNDSKLIASKASKLILSIGNILKFFEVNEQ